jgi:ketosteroid isomerase-like protein
MPSSRFGLSVLVFAAVFPAGASMAQDNALDSLTAAERAFARMATERGIRAAFLANFADDGIAFEPQPVKLVRTWSERPPAADPLARLLEWDPAAAAVSRGGNFGITTGPYALRDRGADKPQRQGVFFSVWRRDGSGPWKVVLDVGATTPQAVSPSMLAPAPRLGPAPVDVVDDTEIIGGFEVRPDGLGTLEYSIVLAEGARLYRDGAMPVAGSGAIAQALARGERHRFAPQDIVVAPARDLAYSYGALTILGGKTERRGYYVHVWTRDAQGAWRIAVSVLLDAASS